MLPRTICALMKALQRGQFRCRAKESSRGRVCFLGRHVHCSGGWPLCAEICQRLRTRVCRSRLGRLFLALVEFSLTRRICARNIHGIRNAVCLIVSILQQRFAVPLVWRGKHGGWRLAVIEKALAAARQFYQTEEPTFLIAFVKPAEPAIRCAGVGNRCTLAAPMTHCLPQKLESAAEKCASSDFGALLKACAQRSAVTLLRAHLSQERNVVTLRKALCAHAMCGHEQFEWQLPFSTDDWLTQASLADPLCIDQITTALQLALFGAAPTVLAANGFGDQEACSVRVSQKRETPTVFVFSWAQAAPKEPESACSVPHLLPVRAEKQSQNFHWKELSAETAAIVKKDEKTGNLERTLPHATDGVVFF